MPVTTATAVQNSIEKPGPARQFPPTADEFVQIVKTIKLTHWVCLSTVGCVDPGTIKYYCSVNNTDLTKDTKKQIAALPHPSVSTKKIKIHVKPMHPQSGVDCGVQLPLAIALALCQGNDPSVLKFTRREVHHHLWSCFQTKQIIEMFPHQEQPCIMAMRPP